jgi:hypothetical protein
VSHSTFQPLQRLLSTSYDASSCATANPIQVSEGKLDGSSITFNCKVAGRTITFNGRINGDEIAFAWELQLQDGGIPPNANDRMFGASAPRKFTAKRVPDAVDIVTQAADQVRRPPAIAFDRILHAGGEPQNWITYSGNVQGQRHSPLTQITPDNVKRLELAWIWQAQSPGQFQATPLVVNGILYTVQAPNDVVALDAVTGRALWTFPYAPSPKARASGGGGSPNRGLAILGDTLFIGTLDAHLLAIDANTGKLIWNTTVADAADPACQGRLCYVITHAPLVVKNKVIVGVGGAKARPAALSRPMMWHRERKHGASTPFQQRVSLAMKRGRAILGKPEAQQCGSPEPTIRTST